MKTKVEGWCEVSTVALPLYPDILEDAHIMQLWRQMGGPFETCVFYEDGMSEVKQRYMSKDMAIAGHMFWLFHEKRAALAAEDPFHDQD